MSARSFVSRGTQTDLEHKQIMVSAAAPAQMYQLNKAGFRITSGRLRDGTYAYLRSDAVSDGYVNTVVRWTKASRKPAQLIVASIKQGRQEDLSFTAGSLRRAIARLDKPRKPAQKPKADPKPEPKPSSAMKLRGVGIYVNNTDMLVAQSAVDACATGLKLSDGTVLEQMERLPLLDLVVMTSTKRNPHWVRVFDGDLPGSSSLTAVFISAASWKTNTTSTQNARVIADFTFGEGKTQYITLLPGTPAYRGAVLLNNEREMVGVLLGAPDLVAMTGSRGLATRKLSVAVSAKPLSPMLHRRGVVHQRARTKASAEATDPASALVAVACGG